MDPNDSSAAANPDPQDGASTAPVEEGQTPDPQPSGDGTGTEPAAPAEGSGTGEEPAQGAEGGEGDDTGTGEGDGQGEEPAADPNKATDSTENENQAVDLKSMSRAERAQYFQNLESSTRKEVEARVNEVYQPQPLEELKEKYIEQGHTDFEAAMLAREEIRDQQAEINQARAERAELNASIAIEATEVLGTIGWLNPQNKGEFDQASSDAATQLYDELCLTRDENTAQKDNQGNPIAGTGQIIGASMTPKQFFGLIDKIRSSGLEGVKITAQKNAEKQMASVAAPSSNSNKQVDKSFDQLSNAEKRDRLIKSGHLVT